MIRRIPSLLALLLLGLPSAASSQTAPAPKTSRSCGAVSHSDDNQTPQDRKAASCLAKAISQCAPATLDLYKHKDSFSVLGKKGADCRISLAFAGEPDKPISCRASAAALSKEYSALVTTPSRSLTFIAGLMATISAANPRANLIYTNEPITCGKPK